MRFVRFAGEGEKPRVGVVQEDTYRVIEGHDDLLGLIQQGEEALRQAGDQAALTGAVVDPATVRNLSPIATPPTFRDFYAFEQHVKAGRESRGLEMNPLWYKIPVFYFSNPYNFRGEGEIPMTPGSERFDFEPTERARQRFEQRLDRRQLEEAVRNGEVVPLLGQRQERQPER